MVRWSWQCGGGIFPIVILLQVNNSALLCPGLYQLQNLFFFAKSWDARSREILSTWLRTLRLGVTQRLRSKSLPTRRTVPSSHLLGTLIRSRVALWVQIFYETTIWPKEIPLLSAKCVIFSVGVWGVHQVFCYLVLRCTTHIKGRH